MDSPIPDDADPEPPPALTDSLSLPLGTGGQLHLDISVESAPAQRLPWTELAAEMVGLALETPLGRDMIDSDDAEVSVLITDDAAVQTLNRTYRHQDKPTNVLSFAAQDEEELIVIEGVMALGDLILAWETTEREAAEKAWPVEAYARHLLLHGALHLVGYDHQSDDQAQTMEALETQVLTALGLPDPYGPEPSAEALSPVLPPSPSSSPA